MVDIPDVEPKLGFPIESVSSVDLCPAGDAGLHIMTSRLFCVVARDILHEQWARAYQTHVSLQHVPELRQLIETRSAEKGTDAREALHIWEELATLVAVVGHGTEFVKLERLAVESRTHLAKKDPFLKKPEQKSNEGADGGYQHSEDSHNGKIEDAFGHAIQKRSITLPVPCTKTELNEQWTLDAKRISRKGCELFD